jgi:predicted O-linked N-acetylglucosamine transferase (SPINDLY family)
LEAYWEALHLQPFNPRVYAAAGAIYLDQGRAEAAVDCFRQSLAQDPDNAVVRSNFLFALNFDPRATPDDIFREHRAYDERHALRSTSAPPRRQANGPLHVGYVSGDFCDYPVSYFFEPILANHSARAIVTTLYSSTPEPDFLTARLRALAGRWRDVRTASDEQMAGMVREDRIDILVDLSGHTSIARLGVFARKPAPVQVTYLGYPNTTGLVAIDYRLTDAWADPPGMTERWHTEELVRLPRGFLCYRPRGTTPAVAKAPCLRAGAFTFGSCSKPLKWNAAVIKAWADILRRVPNSRLALHHSTGNGNDARALEEFFTRGVTPDRIAISGELGWREHWEWFRQVDLALDPFPYHGTTASCETLWMGVPFVSLAGCTHVSRVGVSLLASVGLERLVASSVEEYVETAVRLARDRHALAGLRAGLRDRMQKSPLMDGAGFTRDLEEAYREIWERPARRSVVK